MGFALAQAFPGELSAVTQMTIFLEREKSRGPWVESPWKKGLCYKAPLVLLLFEGGGSCRPRGSALGCAAPSLGGPDFQMNSSGGLGGSGPVLGVHAPMHQGDRYRQPRSTGARWLSPCLCSRRAAAGTTPSSATPPSTKSAWTPSPPSAGRYEKPPAPSLRISPFFCHGIVASQGAGLSWPHFGIAEHGLARHREGRGFAEGCGR